MSEEFSHIISHVLVVAKIDLPAVCGHAGIQALMHSTISPLLASILTSIDMIFGASFTCGQKYGLLCNTISTQFWPNYHPKQRHYLITNSGNKLAVVYSYEL